MRASLLRMLGIVGVSMLLGATYIERFHSDLDWIPSQQTRAIEKTVRKTLAHVQKDETEQAILAKAGIDTDTLVRLAEGGALIIDARAPDVFEESHLAAPYIINVYVASIDVDARIGELQMLLDEGAPIVIYCESLDCDDSKVLYQLISDTHGKTDGLYLYPEGWVGITEAGLAVATGRGLMEPILIMDQCYNEFLTTGGPAGFGADDPNMGMEWPEGGGDG